MSPHPDPESGSPKVAVSADDLAPGNGGSAETPAVRKRLRPGERRMQILQALATMLEQPGSDRVTTAALAARLELSEAALYRHFASKAQMFEGLIEFVEQSIFTLTNQISEREGDARLRTARIIAVLLQFAERNPGMTRVMVGDALVFEHQRLSQRMSHFFDRIESQLKTCLRSPERAGGAYGPAVDAQLRASVLTSFAVGRLQRFARSDFKRLPTENLEASLQLILSPVAGD